MIHAPWLRSFENGRTAKTLDALITGMAPTPGCTANEYG